MRNESGKQPTGATVLVRRSGGLLMGDLLPASYRQSQVVAKVDRDGGTALARVAAINRVAQAAMLGTLNVAMMKREACLLVPEDAAKFDLVATQAAMGFAGQVSWISTPC